MQPVTAPCWGLGLDLVDAYDMFATEILHVMDLGIIKAIVVHLSKLPCAGQIQQRLDAFPRQVDAMVGSSRDP
jgi:hypothetical protein